MQAVSPRRELFEAVQTVGRAVSGRTSLPILSHVLARPVGDGRLRLMATDLEMWLECSIGSRISFGFDDGDQPGFTFPAKLFTEMLGAFAESDVVLDRPDVKAKTSVRCGRSNYELLGLSPDEFPAPPEVDHIASFTIAGGLLKSLIKEVNFAVSTDETRVILTGVLLKFDGTAIKLVATDTHRLAVTEGNVASGDGAGNAVVPARAMNEVLRLAGDDDAVQVVLANGQARFEFRKRADDKDTDAATVNGLYGRFRVDTTTMITQLIDGQFPNYERVIPQNYDRKLTIDRGDFIASVKRVAIVAKENAQRVVLETQGDQLALTAESGTIGTGRDEIEVAREGADIAIAFNAKYLADALNAIDAEGVALEMTEPLRPGVIRPVGGNRPAYLCVLMPMQVI